MYWLRIVRQMLPIRSHRAGWQYRQVTLPQGVSEVQPDMHMPEAKKTVGRDYTIDELFKEINKDKIFYDIKGGGVTFSGENL